MPSWQQDSVLLTGRGIYPQIYHRAPCPAMLFVRRGLISNNRGGDREGVGLFQISQKFRLLISYDNQVLLVVIAQCSPLFCTFQKRPLYPLQIGQIENIPGHSVERKAYWFVLKVPRVFPISTGRMGIGWWPLYIS